VTVVVHRNKLIFKTITIGRSSTPACAEAVACSGQLPRSIASRIEAGSNALQAIMNEENIVHVDPKAARFACYRRCSAHLAFVSSTVTARRPLFCCVYAAIRERFPEGDGRVFTGFKKR